jgi:CBS domain-containing protein
MAQLREILNTASVPSVDAEQTALEAARYMVERNIGAVPVLDKGELIGVFSERDLMKRVVVGARSPGSTPVRDVMTARPKTVSPDDSIDDCLTLMREHGFRHLPVCEGKTLLGFITMPDLMAAKSRVPSR